MRKRLEEIAFSRLKNDKDNAILWWEGKWFSGSHVLDVVDQCRKNLEEKGFGAGDRLVLFSQLSSGTLSSLAVAAWGTVVPLNSRSGKEATIAMLHHICPWGVITSDEKGLWLKPCPSLPFPGPLLLLKDLSRPFKAVMWRRGILKLPLFLLLLEPRGSQGSASTHSNLYDNTLKVQQTIEGFEEHQTLLNVLPNFHSGIYDWIIAPCSGVFAK